MTKRYTSRSTMIFVFFCGLYCIIAITLYRIQIQQHEFFTHLGEKQYIYTNTVYPPRGTIYDRSGKELALNRDSLAAFILPKSLTAPQTLKPFLKKYFPLAYQRLLTTAPTHFMYVARRLTEEQRKLIESHAIADIQFLHEPSRFYPIPSAGHIIGITDIDNNGLFGIEMHFNTLLSGKPTTYTLERDARSGHFYFKRHTTQEGTDSQALTLTLDGDLQFLTYEALKKTMAQWQAQEGAVLVMNPRSGEVLAMAIIPDFDPNDTRQLALDTTKNRIITETYELGSVIKTFGTLAALEENSVQDDELIDCENVKTAYVDGRKINTVPASVAGLIPFSQVIEKSNNIGIAKVVKRLGPKLYDHYIRLGFGKKTGIEFPGERSGFVNPPEKWSKQSIISLSYGYEITATLLQLAYAFCIIANDGYAAPAPTLRMPVRPHEKKQRLYSARSITTIKRILENTVMQGTAKKARINGYTVMAKTGTGNLLINGSYQPDHNIFTCAGIVQKDSYQRVIVAFIKEVPRKNVYASTIAAPLFEQVAEKMLIHDKIL